MGFLTIRTRPRLAMIAAAALLVATAVANPLRAQERFAPAGTATLTDGSVPPVVVTLGSLNKLVQDTNYVTGVVGQPMFGAMFGGMVGSFAQGMDMDRPIGLVLTLANGTPQPIIMLPTADIKPILKRFEAQTGPLDELDDGTLVVTMNPNTIYIKQQGGVAIAAQDPNVLKLAPADPSGLFAGMGNAYDLAVRLRVQEVPAPIRNMLTDQMRQGFEQAMARQPNSEGAREMAEGPIEQLEQLIRESDEINLGINIDQAAGNILIKFSATAVGGTELATMYGGQQSIPSRFSSVIRDDAAAYFHSAGSISPEAIEKASDSMTNTFSMLSGALANDGNMSADQIAAIEGYLDRLGEIIKESLAEGKSDVGGVLLAERDKIQFAMGGFVGDGTKLAGLAKDLAKEVPDGPSAPRFKFDAGTFGGVTMHLIEGDVPASADEARKVFGDTIRVHIGTAPKAFYLALGRDSEGLLKELISSGGNDNSSDRPLGQFKLRLLPILEFAQSVEANDSVAAIINALSSTNDKGELTAVSDSIPNGSSTEIRIGEGLIKAIGTAAMRGQNPPPAF